MGILPMVAMTLLTVSTMWMSPGNVGPRVNSGTKMLLCVVSIIFITARNRPAVSGDIWMDRFQSHCLALSMFAVLESLFVDWLFKVSMKTDWLPIADRVDSVLRSVIAFSATFVMFSDAKEVQRRSDDSGMGNGTGMIWLFASLHERSTSLLIGFIYFLLLVLLTSSVFSIVWLFVPASFKRQIVK